MRFRRRFSRCSCSRERLAARRPSNPRLPHRHRFVGFGVCGIPNASKELATILAVFPNSPAERGGILPHDALLALNGYPLVTTTQSYVQLLRGPECTGAVLTLRTPGQEPRPLTLVRDRVTSPLPVYERLVPTSDGSRIGYLFIPTFFDRTIPDQVRAALEALGPLDGLIVDDRMNGGGVGEVLDQMLGYFTAGLPDGDGSRGRRGGPASWALNVRHLPTIQPITLGDGRRAQRATWADRSAPIRTK